MLRDGECGLPPVKCLVFILFSFIALLTAQSQLAFSPNCTIILLGDSFFISTQPPSITGLRIPDYVESYFQLSQVGKGIHTFNISRSGGSMDDVLTNRVHPYAIPLWGYQTNNFQHVGMVLSTDNGGLSSNQMLFAHSNIYQAPFLMSDGDATLHTHAGWASTNLVQWVGLGYMPEGSDGQESERQRNNAGTNAGWGFGVLGIDFWNRLSVPWTNDFNANGGTNVQWFTGDENGHFASGGALSSSFALFHGTPSIASDTNIATCTVDWNSTSPVATNHCVISSISKSGNTLTFIRHDDRLPFAWDVADGTITNDARGAFNLTPSDADFFRFSVQVTNLPAGNYNVLIDGVLCSTLSDTQLGTGWNMVTNVAGPYWAQRKEVLGRIRDKEHVDRVTLVPGSASDGQGMVAYGSLAATKWASGLRGDALIASLTTSVSNLYYLDSLTAAAAVPTNHTFTIQLAIPATPLPWIHN